MSKRLCDENFRAVAYHNYGYIDVFEDDMIGYREILCNQTIIN